MTTVVWDLVDAPLAPGIPVVLAGAADLADRERYGVVVGVSDADCDVDDEGRSYGINPKVSVRFYDGVEDAFRTAAIGSWWQDDDDPSFRCEDLVAVTRRGSLRRAWWALRRLDDRTKGLVQDGE